MLPLDWLNMEDSSRMRRVKYEPNKFDARGDLLVEFNEGKVYRYKDVPMHKVERMVHNSSPGTYFHGYIRGEHAAERVDG